MFRVLAVVSGAAMPLAFAPFGWFWLAPVSLSLFFFVLDVAGPREAFLRGFLFGLGMFAAGTWWLYISISGFGGAPIAVAIVLMGGLMGAMGVYLGLLGYLAARWGGQPGPWRWMVFLPALWTLVEWLRGWLLSGFPWLSLGYSQIDGPLSGWAPVGGTYGTTLVISVMAGALLTLFRGTRVDRGIAAAAIVLLGGTTWAISGRDWTQPDGSAITVTLAQGGISQDMKWLPSQLLPTLNLYRDLTLENPDSQLFIWPEAALPATAGVLAPFLEAMDEILADRGAGLITGILTRSPVDRRYRNTLMTLGDGAGVYYKRHLVPFGEYFPVPDIVRGWLRLMNLPSEDTVPGPRRQAPLQASGMRLAPSICYEDAFGAEMLDFLPAAGMLVNVSNDGWFGDSIAPHQHLEMARMRALETGRFMLRATNTGITAVVGPRGEIVAQAPQFEPFALTAEVQPFQGATPYTLTGNLPVIVLCLMLCFLPRLVSSMG